MRTSETGENRFEIAYNKYADILYRIALSHMSHREDAEDVVQDVFIKYVQSSIEFSDDEHEKAWLIRVTVNRCRDLLRRRTIRRYVTFDEIEEIAEEDGTEDESGVISLVSSLPDKYKSVMVLHYLEGFSVEEVSKKLKLSLSAVKMRLSRGRDLLKNLINEEEG